MPTTRIRRNRNRVIGAGGITEVDYIYFTFGDFFDAEDYEIGKSEEELKSFWLKHREKIMERYRREYPDPSFIPWSVKRWDEIGK